MPTSIADYNLPATVLPCYAHLDTHHFFLLLTFIRKNTLVKEQNPRQSAYAKKSCGSASVD